ncbi:MAG TPA: c-type cytochrome [Anaerolineae bacterium]|nr:c-type cytochrome [Anaerolineae bacterium]
MQIKISIGIISLMATMTIFAYTALREPARLSRYTAAYQARTIENGALLFQQNCVTCHGTYGQAQEGCSFINEDGIETGLCRGLPLDTFDLLCNDYSRRMDAMNTALNKEAFIRSTIATGRGQIMPAWSAAYGGPLAPHEIDQLTTFILNWTPTQYECESQLTHEPRPPQWSDYLFSNLPEGNPDAGQKIFAITAGCQACHGDPQGDASTATVGPWLGNIAAEGATKIDGYTADDYLYESILNPDAYIVEQCPIGPCPASIMPQNFDNTLYEQDMADLLAYLLGRSTFTSTTTIRFIKE